MATIESIIAGYEKEVATCGVAMQKLLDQVAAEGRSHVSLVEDQALTELKERRDTARANLARSQVIQNEDNAQEERLTGRTRLMPDDNGGQSGRSNYDTSVRIGEEAKTYNRGNDADGSQFLADVVKATMGGDYRAQERLSRSRTEFERDWSAKHQRTAGDLPTSALGNFVVPAFLIDLSAMAVSNSRPFADACRSHTLPAEGMTLSIPQLGPTSAAIQGTELTGVSATSMTEADLVLNVKTFAGQQLISRQAAERSAIGTFAMSDLLVRVNAELDKQMITAASVGLDAVATSYTTTLTGSGDAQISENLYGNIGAASAVDVSLSGIASPNLVVMHSRRWRAMQAALVSAWPLVGSGPGGVGTSVGSTAGTTGGRLQSDFKVVADRNVKTNAGTSTNQDVVYVTSADECHLWELPGQPVFIRAEQVAAASLGILLVAYSYAAWTFQRYSASVQSITGAGLAGATFTG